ncbi:MAG: hypothetical protein VYD57_15300 [Pseudomonadota bacterium]|nr:hypothetical protein [Pseudomonadota bacterium]
MRKIHGLSGALAAAALLATGLSAFAQTSYFDRFNGNWSGGGTVRLDTMPAPVNVSCDAAGARTKANAFSLNARCRAMLVFSREFGADLSRDPKSGAYTGVYRGAKSGPARLSGQRKDSTLDLQVTWGREIYGDNKARMLIRHEGGNTFSIQVIDQIDGKPVIVSDLSFERS